eukprot:scaffold75202_cov27-Tisochrysis_lutea.AAC.1
MPTSVKRSASMHDLIFRSRGASALSDGDKLTSSSHGLSASSISTSKPSISKHAPRCPPAETIRRWAAVTEGSTAMSAFNTKSSMRRQSKGTFSGRGDAKGKMTRMRYRCAASVWRAGLVRSHRCVDRPLQRAT